MTLSCNTWGMRSLLCSIFFNVEVECNLVSAWINPAFTVIDPLVKEESFTMLAKVLASRSPKLSSLWLGAILVGIAKSILQTTRIGLTALELNASAWTGIEQSLITGKPSTSDEITIRREDERRLLFVTSQEEHARLPIHPWKPFGETRLHDTELQVQLHSGCSDHFLNYQYWGWYLKNGGMLKDAGMKTPASGEAIPTTHNWNDAPQAHCSCDLSSQSVSQSATHGIFSWLRSTGYPANEKPLYQHSWIDLESSDDEEEEDDSKSDTAEGTVSLTFVDDWLGCNRLTVKCPTVPCAFSTLRREDERNSMYQLIYCIRKATDQHMYWRKHIKDHIKKTQ